MGAPQNSSDVCRALLKHLVISYAVREQTTRVNVISRLKNGGKSPLDCQLGNDIVSSACCTATLARVAASSHVLTDINADYGNRTLCCRSHGVLLVLAPLASLSLAGQEHGRTIPLADLRKDNGFPPFPI